MVFSAGSTIGGLGGTNNYTVLITGTGSVWSNSASLTVGGNGSQLTIINGGVVFSTFGNIGAYSAASNAVLVTGAGSVWNNSSDLKVDNFGSMTIANSGVVFNAIGYVGYIFGVTNNAVLVTGAGSVWSSSSNLYVGYNVTGNQLTITNGGKVNAQSVMLGYSTSSSNNNILAISSGNLISTNTGFGSLDVRRGSMTMDSGTILCRSLLLTNGAKGTFTMTGGTLAANIITNGGSANLVVSGGTIKPLNINANWSAALVADNMLTFSTSDANGQARSVNMTGALSGGGQLNVTGTGSLRLNGPSTSCGLITVSSGATLGGTGAVGSVQILSNATLATFNAMGTFSATNLTLNGGAHIQVEINATNGVPGIDWDLINVAGPATLSGISSSTPLTVDVVNRGGLTGSTNPPTALSWTFLTASGGISGYDLNGFAFTTTGLAGWTNGIWLVTQTNNNLQLRYTATPASIIGLSGDLAFGNVMAGSTSNRMLTISNTGNVPLTVTNISYPGGFSGAWSGILPAGGSTNVTVTFSPVAVTTYSGTVTVNSDATLGGSTLAASGMGAASAVVTVQANPTNAGSVAGGGMYFVGSNTTLTATASNNWLFINWNDGDTNAARTITVPATNISYTANFAAAATISVGANTNAGGFVTGSGVFILGSNAVLAATASNGWQFISWSDGLTNNPRTIMVASNMTYTATFAPTAVITAQANPVNGGSVIGGGTYVVGSNAVLTATASNNWLFTSWTGGVTNNPWTIVVPATNITYTANFAAAATITVGANTNAGGSVTGSGVFIVGSNAVLSATASNNWWFIRWNDGSTNNPRTIVVTSNMTYTATFAPTALITVQANPVAGGSVTGGGTYVVGSNAVLVATASNLWRFISWNDSVTNNPRTVTVPDGGATYTANFSPLGTVTVLANPTNGGSVAGGGLYLAGSNITVTATASNSWLFLNWNGSVTNNLWSFSVLAGTTICTANFARLSTVTVLANPSTGGTVTGGGLSIVGSNTTLTAIPSSNWAFSRWNDGNINASRSITVPTTNITYAATFLPPATVTVRANPSTYGSVFGGGTFQVGSNVNISATPVPGWVLINWSDGNTNLNRSITVPASNITYTANFAMGIGAAVDAPTLAWSTGGNANWTVQTATTHDGVAALKSGAITAGQQTWFQTTTNGPGSLLFWWKVSSAATNYLQFYIGTQLVNQISGNVNWNQYVTYIGTSNPVTLKWVYTKNSSAVSGSDAGWVDQVTWIPCPYATNVPQLFFQEPAGMIASWVVNSTGAFQFARVLANTGGWALKSAGDINGDGVSDLLFQNSASDTGGWFLNADGSVRDARFWFNIGGWEIKASGDYENIGRAQIFFQTAAGSAAYWRLDTNGAFLAAVPLGNMAGWKLRGAGDLDGDHKAELFWQNAAGQVAIWYHDGPGGSTRGSLAFNTGEWALCGVTDVDLDGACDLLWQTPDTRTGGWFMQTNGTARAASFWWPTGGWKLKAAGR